mgnify:CR=1 FL=1
MADEDSKFHIARGIGIDILKLLLNVVISLNIVPLVFHENISKFFGNKIFLVYSAWIAILITVLLGFLTYFFIFEGYYHQALKKDKIGDGFLDWAHYIGIGCLIAFVFAILLMIVGIVSVVVGSQ